MPRTEQLHRHRIPNLTDLLSRVALAGRLGANRNRRVCQEERTDVSAVARRFEEEGGTRVIDRLAAAASGRSVPDAAGMRSSGWYRARYRLHRPAF